MYAKILVTLDGSDLALAALPEVAHLSGPESVVLLVEVVDTVAQLVARTSSTEPEFDGGGTGIDTADRAVAAQREGADRQLREAAAHLASDGVEHVECHVLDGHAGDAIVEFAEREDVDVIVMATHGRSGVVRAVLGSVSDHVARHSRVPVLLVNPGAHVAASVEPPQATA